MPLLALSHPSARLVKRVAVTSFILATLVSALFLPQTRMFDKAAGKEHSSLTSNDPVLVQPNISSTIVPAVNVTLDPSPIQVSLAGSTSVSVTITNLNNFTDQLYLTLGTSPIIPFEPGITPNPLQLYIERTTTVTVTVTTYSQTPLGD